MRGYLILWKSGPSDTEFHTVERAMRCFVLEVEKEKILLLDQLSYVFIEGQNQM